MNITIPEYVDLSTLATLFDSDRKRTREMVHFMISQGYGIEIIPWGKNRSRKKYNYPQFKRALLDHATSTTPHIR